MLDNSAGLKREHSGVVLMLLVYTSFTVLALPDFCSFFRVLDQCEHAYLKDSNYVLQIKFPCIFKSILHYLIFVLFDFSCVDLLCISVT